MTENSMDLSALVVQRPTTAAQLVLLFHGEFTSASAMLPCAQALAATFPHALVACVQAPYPAAGSDAQQWLAPAADPTLAGEAALVAQVDAALPVLLEAVHYWQAQAAVGPEATALVGFGQGALLVLESTQQPTPPAHRVVALAGRFARLPETGHYPGSIHFLHGKHDTTVPYQHTLAAAYRVRDLGMDLTAQVIPFVGHEIHPDFITATVEKLSTHIPKHLLVDQADTAPAAPSH